MALTERLRWIIDLDTGPAVREARQSSNQIGQGLNKASGSARTFARDIRASWLAVSAFAGGAILGFKAITDSAAALEQAIGGTEAVFGDARDTIDRFAEDSAQSMGLSERAFREATTRLGGSLKALGFETDEAADKAIELTTVAADLAATYGGTTADAVDALAAAFRGESDPAERFNLFLKEQAVNAKAVELGLAESTAAVDQGAKAQARYALIMEQSVDAQGQFSREADTATGQQQRMNAEWENAKAALGESLLPVVTDYTSSLSKALQVMSDPGWESFSNFLTDTFANEDFGGGISLGDVLGLDDAAEDAGEWVDIGPEATRQFDSVARSSRDAARDIDAQTEAIRNLNDAHRATVDPLFAVLDADQRLLDAMNHLNEVRADSESSAADLAAAELDVAAAAGDLESAEYDLLRAVEDGTLSTDLARDALNRWVSQGRLTQAQADRIAARFDAVAARADRLHGRNIAMSMSLNTTLFNAQLNSALNRVHNNIVSIGGFDAGGVVPGPRGAPTLAVVHGGETILPTHKAGFTGAGVSLNATIILQGGGYDAGEQVVAALSSWVRRSTVPEHVRRAFA